MKLYPYQRRIACKMGVHDRVLEGGGAMGDGLTCVDCGRDKYPEVFGVALNVRPWPGLIDRSPEGRLAAWEAGDERP